MLEFLITSRTRRRLLKIFLNNIDKRFYVRELTRKTNENINSVRKELKSLEKIGLLREERIANLQYYFINKDFQILAALKEIILKTDPIRWLIDNTQEVLINKFKKNLTSIVLFGSYARNEEKDSSDLDLLIVLKSAPADWRKRDELKLKIDKELPNPVIPVHFEITTEKELIFSIEEGAPLLFNIVYDYKVIYDNGFFDNAMKKFKSNMVKWKAKRTKDAWEVPELAVKI